MLEKTNVVVFAIMHHCYRQPSADAQSAASRFTSAASLDFLQAIRDFATR
jgi:hypothetical protein